MCDPLAFRDLDAIICNDRAHNRVEKCASLSIIWKAACDAIVVDDRASGLIDERFVDVDVTLRIASNMASRTFL